MRRERSPVTGNYQSEKGSPVTENYQSEKGRESCAGNYRQSEKGRESCDCKLPG